jgi:hypothetical protein
LRSITFWMNDPSSKAELETCLERFQKSKNPSTRRFWTARNSYATRQGLDRTARAYPQRLLRMS